MKFMSNLRISHKIIALMVGLTVGFIVIGVIYYVQVTLGNSSRTTERSIHHYQQLLANSYNGQIRLRQSARQFTLARDAGQLQNYRDAFEDLQQKLGAVTDMAEQFNRESLVGGAASQVEHYHQLVLTLVEKLQALGLHETEGLRALLGADADALESALQDQGQMDALTNFLRLRALDQLYIGSAEQTNLKARNSILVQLEASTTTVGFDSAGQSLSQLVKAYDQRFGEAVALITRVRNMGGEIDSAGSQVESAFNQMLADAEALASTHLAESSKQTQLLQAVVTAVIFMVAMGTAVGVYFIYKSIVFPMAHMQSVIRRINRGKTKARVQHLVGDELGDLGLAFNRLLDERIEHLEQQSLENERLNNSIISLITTLGVIAKKDLTVKVPVSPDITGTISDAVNLLTSETARTLHQVRDISEQVNKIAEQLREQSSSVVAVAEDERRHVNATSKALEMAAKAMNDIARRAGSADDLAQQAINHTKSARGTVLETVSGIRVIRETISETEKRMKRLGDRSQEISGIVNLINTIAERTHILALNASMHAASAGEAGKGFAVVADEVQRLAENAREATAEISSMVNNIRVETSDTVNIMNTLISQVADGSRLAEQAGQRMDDTERATNELVEDVKSIAEGSLQQAQMANRIRDRASMIRRFTEKTGQQLDEQKRHTDSLVEYAATLVSRVNAFTLPDAPRDTKEPAPLVPIQYERTEEASALPAQTVA